MCEFHESTCNGFGDIWWTDNPIYFSSIDRPNPKSNAGLRRSTPGPLPLVPGSGSTGTSLVRYRSGNLLIITPSQDSVISSNNTNSSVLFSVSFEDML